MFKLKNYKNIFNNNCFLNAIKTIERRQESFRFQSVASGGDIANESNTNYVDVELEKAKPYSEMPTISKFKLFKEFLAGGKYANLDSTQLFLALKNDLGNVSRLPGFFGRKEMVLTHNIEDFEQVLRNEGIWPFRPGSEALQYHRHVHRADFFQGVEGLISTQGETWGRFRSAVNPVMMQTKNIRLYLHKMSQANQQFIERIRHIRDPQTLEVPDNFYEEINRWTLESVSVVALDKNLGLITGSHNDTRPKKLFQALNDFNNYSTDIEFKPSVWKYYKTPTFKKLMNTLDKIVDVTSSYVNEAIERLEKYEKSGLPEKPEQEKSVLEKLIKIDKGIATVMAMDMLMVGVDTTSSSFTAILLCLAKFPDKQEKLRQEVLQILPKKDTEFDQDSFKNMQFLRACIKESQRYYPLVIGNARAPIRDVVISGYRVPKGTQVSLCSFSLLRDSKHYPSPEAYLPERWLRAGQGENESANSECPKALKTTNPFVHLPFGFGARSCIGRRIVEMELELGIARLLRNYKIEFHYPTENAFKSLLINVPNIPLKFKFIDLDY